MKKANFDQDSGQMYTTTEVRAIRPKDRNWTELSQYRGRAHEEEPWPNTGSRNLSQMAVTKVIKHIDEVNMDMLDPIPDQILLRLWRQINRRHRTNFMTWKNFSKLIVRRIDDTTGRVLSCHLATFDLYRYEQHIHRPVLPLLDYIQPLTSPTFDFISCLSISENLSTAEFIQLAKLPNLGVLQLMYVKTDQVSAVNDRLVRAWSDAVATLHAFPVLRVLNLLGFPDVTIKSLHYVSRFPALGLFHIRSSNFATKELVKSEARKHKWKYQIREDCQRTPSKDLLAAWKANSKDAFPKVCSQKWDDAKVSRRTISQETTNEAVGTSSLSHGMQSSRYSEEELALQQVLGLYYDLPWQPDLHSQFALIGRMRNESDLKEASINLPTDQKFYVGDNPIPPIPIALLHLGKRDAAIPQSQRSGHSLSGISFIRLNPSREIPVVPEAHLIKPSQPPKSSNSGLTLRPNKKMKFDLGML